ncbi:Hypothetical protein D9617_1g082560 [Elsinoe fawcettii]|nr:Hypothetical protein D9617_1g082560 [Elsinoe fawcettii]
MTNKPPKHFPFVTATCPADFKNKDTLKSVRKAVMQDYLERARNDPKSSDKRVKGNPKASHDDSVSPQLSTSSSTSQAYMVDGVHPTFSSTSDRFPPRSDSPMDGMLGTTVLNPMIKPRMDQLKYLALADHLNGRRLLGARSEEHRGDPAFVPGLSTLERRMAFSVAYHRKQRYGHADFHSSLGSDETPVSLDLDLLKINCATYFGSQAAFEQWVPLTSAAPHTFLASLCISAPYTDLIDHPSGDDASPCTDTRHTMELMDILPRIITDRLGDEADPNSDSNIIAVAYLLTGQLSTPYTSFIAAHQAALRRMVIARGGLRFLGGNGVIAMNLVLANLEASIMRHEQVDRMYLDWIDTYLTDQTPPKTLSPESPLYFSPNGMLAVACSPLCKSETLHLVLLMHELTEKAMQLEHLQKRTSSRHSRDRTEMTELCESVHSIIQRTHQMPPMSQHAAGEKDWIYESVRLAALLFCHAVSERKPLQSHLRCNLALNCKVTPTMIQEAVARTPIKPLWDHLAGVLYWVLMIASTACRWSNTTELEHDLGSTAESQLPSLTQHQKSVSGGRNYGAIVRARETYDQVVLSEQSQHTPTDSFRSDQIESSPYSWEQVYDPPPGYIRADRSFANARALYHSYASAESSTPDSSTADSTPGTLSRSNDSDTDQYTSRMADTHRPQRAHQDPAWTPVLDHRRRPETSTANNASKRIRPETYSGEQRQERAQAKAAYIKRYLTANAMRVSILLRFEHTVVFLASVRNLLRVTQWLAGD